MTASMPHPVDTRATTKTPSHQGASPTPAPAAHPDSKKKCGRMFFKSCSNDGDCCSSHGWTCGKDKRCVWHHASLNELLPCHWITKLTTNIAHLLSSKVCVVGSKFCGSDEQDKLAQLACKDIGLHEGNPLAKLCQGAELRFRKSLFSLSTNVPRRNFRNCELASCTCVSTVSKQRIYMYCLKGRNFG